MGFVSKLSSIDAYAKTSKDVKLKTLTGALLTIGSFCLTLLLVGMEFYDFFKVRQSHFVSVDATKSGNLEISFEIDFPHAPCALINIDIMDYSGLRHSNISSSIEKTRLNAAGKSLGSYSVAQENINITKTNHQDFLSCHGAREGDCNSCEDLRKAFKDADMDFTPVYQTAKQCIQERYLDRVREAATEGCRVKGSIKGQKYAGNFHFSPGVAFDKDGMHGHLVDGLENVEFNFTHTIKSLRFGDHDPTIKSPLENESKHTNSRDTRFSYHLRLVSSTLKDGTKAASKAKTSSASSIEAFEYSATQNVTEVGTSRGVTGIVFHYEISPMKIERSHYRKSFTELLINILSIVGGVYAVSSIIDAILFKVELALAKKAAIGKAF